METLELTRTDRSQLYVAEPIQFDDYSLLRVPQLSRSMLIGDLYEQKHLLVSQPSRAADQFNKYWKYLHIERAGLADAEIRDASSLLRRIEADKSYAQIVPDMQAVYEGMKESARLDMQKYARRMATVVRQANLFAVVNFADNRDDIFAARIVDAAFVERDSNAVGAVEPIVEAITGERALMPEQSYFLHGFYGLVHE